METWSLIVGIASLLVGIVSILLALVAMAASRKEADRSAENYNNTKDLLNKIEHKTDLIDRAVQLQQTQLLDIVNKALDKVGQDPIEMVPLSLEEIDKLFDEKTKGFAKVRCGKELPSDLKEGEIFFQYE